MIQIKDMVVGNDNVEFTAIISQVTTGKTNGAKKSSYLNLVFQDSTGNIDAKMWAVTQEDIDKFVVGTVCEGTGDIISYLDNRQMKVTSLKVFSNDEEEQVKYLQSAPYDAKEMMNGIESYIHKIQNTDIKQIVETLIHEHYDQFMLYPAASRNHHEFVSGLVYHTLSMLKVGESLVNIYPSLKSDYIYAGILLHDIGKTVELSGPVVPSYTLEGKLLGHISISQAMIKQVADQKGIRGEVVTILQHLVLSHHGKNEYGSPVLPQIKEAEMIYLIDNIDSRMNMLDKALDQINEGEYTKRIFALENRSFYKPHD